MVPALVKFKRSGPDGVRAAAVYWLAAMSSRSGYAGKSIVQIGSAWEKPRDYWRQKYVRQMSECAGKARGKHLGMSLGQLAGHAKPPYEPCPAVAVDAVSKLSSRPPKPCSFLKHLVTCAQACAMPRVSMWHKHVEASFPTAYAPQNESSVPRWTGPRLG